MALKIHGTDNIQAGTVQTEVLAGGVGGGPKITNITVTDSSYTNTDDTAVGLSGGYIKITGTGFSSGCQVVVGATVATAVVFVSSTEVRAEIPAQSAGSYTLYLTNSDGGVAIRVNAVNYSSTPTWTTTSPLPDSLKNTSISLQLAATSNSTVTYTLQAGSSLPSGLSLSSSGLITGTTPDIANETIYNFTVVATDQENQDTPQAFQVTITVNDLYFKYVTLLLNNQTNNVLTDSSTNNFSLTAAGDARASNFSPYGTGWSAYFDGNNDYLTTPSNTAFTLGTGDFTIECWFNRTGANTGSMLLIDFRTAEPSVAPYIGVYGSGASGGLALQLEYYVDGATRIVTTTAPNANEWYHVAVVRSSGITKMYLNGSQVGSNYTDANNYVGSSPVIGGRFAATSGDYRSWFGYISNMRVVKGVAVYTGAFTPPTSLLAATQSSGTNISAITGTQTSLLTCQSNRFLDTSSNAFAITINGDVKVTTFNPFGITNTGVNGSAYFDGTEDYLTVPDNAVFDFGSGDFTIETWFYSTAPNLTANNLAILDTRPAAAPTTGNYVLSVLSEKLRFAYVNTSSGDAFYDSTETLKINTWYHVAITRSGNNLRMFINGNLDTTWDVTGKSFNAELFNIAYKTLTASSLTYWQGYLSSMRLLKGTAVYTSNFTPPTQPLAAIANTSLLTLQYKQPHNNHSFLDSSSNQFLITRSGNTTQGTFSPFSQTGWGNYFDGTGAGAGAALSFPANAAFSFSGDFTIEFWIYPLNNNNTSPSIFLMSLPGSTFLAINCQAGSYLSAFLNTSGAAFTSTDQVPAVNAWSHVALVRSGSTVKFYVNGVASSSTATNSSTLGSSTVTPFITNSSNTTACYISNFRITNGQSLYTTNFTPTTSPLTTTSQGATAGNVKLLTCQNNRFIDNSSNNFSVTLVNSPSVVAFSPFNPTASWSAVANGGSGYFDGIGDYLQLPITALTGQFTIEFWFYRAVTGNNFMFTIGDSLNATGSKIYIGTSGTILNYYTGQAARITATPPDAGSWSYIAATRDSSNIVRLYVNGTQVGGTYTHAATLDTTLRVGAQYYNGAVGGITNGYISDFRISNIVRTITLPTQPLVADANTLCLLNFTNAGIYDATGKNVLETIGDAKISSAQSKWGGSSMLFDGTGDYLSLPNINTLNLQSGDFTVECWLYTNNAATSQTIFWLGGTDSSSATLRFGVDTNGINLYMGNSGLTGWEFTTGVIGSISSSTWTHVAATRSGNNYRVFINGSQVGTTITNSNAIGASTQNRIGALNFTSGGFPVYREFNGYIQDLRITKGYARYTANFTPPTAAFPTL